MGNLKDKYVLCFWFFLGTMWLIRFCHWPLLHLNIVVFLVLIPTTWTGIRVNMKQYTTGCASKTWTGRMRSNYTGLGSPAGHEAGFLQGQNISVSSWCDTLLPVLLQTWLTTSLFPSFFTITQEKGFTYFFNLQSLYHIQIFHSGHWQQLFKVPWLLKIFHCMVPSGLNWVPVPMSLPLILICHIPYNLPLHSNYTLTLINSALTTTTPTTL